MEEGGVRQHDGGEDVGHPGHGVGHRCEHERLTAGDAEAPEAELARLAGPIDHPRGVEHASGDGGAGLGEAVGALEVAVVVGVQPEALTDHPFGDGLGHERAHAALVKPSAASRSMVEGATGKRRVDAYRFNSRVTEARRVSSTISWSA